MTVSEIVSLASSLIKRNITVKMALPWITDFLKTIGVKADNFGLQEYSSAEKNTWYQLPSDFLKVQEVRDGNDYVYEGWEANSSYIRFKKDGNYIVRYWKIPDAPSGGNDVPSCHEILHIPIAYYIAYRLEAGLGVSSQSAASRYAEFQAKLSNALMQLQGTSQTIRLKWSWF